MKHFGLLLAIFIFCLSSSGNSSKSPDIVGYKSLSGRGTNTKGPLHSYVPTTTGKHDTYFEHIEAKKINRNRTDLILPEYQLKKSPHRDEKPHAIFFVHGLLGNRGTWGHLEHILKKTFYPFKNIKIKNLTYPTRNNMISAEEFNAAKNLHPISFGKILNAKIISFLVEEGLTELQQCAEATPQQSGLISRYKKCLFNSKFGFNEKGIAQCQRQMRQKLPACAQNIFNLDTDYSIIVHSQGGLNIASYLNSCYLSRETKSESRYCRYEDAIDIYQSIVKVSLKDLATEPRKKAPSSTKRKRKRGPGNTAISPLRRYEITKLFENNSLKKDVRTPKNLKNLISLGSPFWGSPTANYGQRKFQDFDILNLGPFAFEKYNFLALLEVISKSANFPLPLKQINRLAIGSAGLEQQRGFMLNMRKMKNKVTGEVIRGPQDWGPDIVFQRRYPNDLKVYNLAGIISHLDSLKVDRNAIEDEIDQLQSRLRQVSRDDRKKHEQLASEIEQLKKQRDSIESSLAESVVSSFVQPTEYENDVIVGAPEARMDFIYNLENPLEGHSPLVGMTNITTEFLPTRGSHVNISKNTRPIAQILFEEKEDNPSWHIIQQIFENEFGLANKDQPIRSYVNDYLIEELRNFTSEIKLLTPPGYQRRFYIDPDRVSIDPEKEGVFAKTKLKNKVYIQAYGYNQSDEMIGISYPQTFYHVGKLHQEYALRPRTETIEDYKSNLGQLGHQLNYEFDVLGFHKKKLSQFVLPGVNSYGEGYLEPYHPIAPNPLNKLGTKVGSLRVNPTTVRHFYLDGFGSIVHEDEEDPSSNPVCHIGLMGNAAPPKFRFRSIYKEDYLEEDQPTYPSRVTVRNFSFDRFSEDPYLVNRWFWYAPHRNLELLNFNQAEVTLQDPRIYEELQAEPGTAYEVLGRATTGFQDPRFGFARDCHKREKRTYGDRCRETPIDRYLVTSYNIRRADGVRLNEVGLESRTIRVESANGGQRIELAPKGLRWVNVKDVDLFQPHQKVPYITYEFVEEPLHLYMGTPTPIKIRKTTAGNHCLLNNGDDNYLDHSQYQDKYFYPYNIKEN